MSDLRALAEAARRLETDEAPLSTDIDGWQARNLLMDDYRDACDPQTILGWIERAGRAEAALRDLLPYATSHKQVVDGGPLCDAPLLGDWIKCNCGQREARERARAALESAK